MEIGEVRPEGSGVSQSNGCARANGHLGNNIPSVKNGPDFVTPAILFWTFLAFLGQKKGATDPKKVARQNFAILRGQIAVHFLRVECSLL
jgi:hypothetical protein